MGGLKVGKLGSQEAGRLGGWEGEKGKRTNFSQYAMHHALCSMPIPSKSPSAF